MLSYRHIFHAGNTADVLKHLTLVLTLQYYTLKDKPFWYIDTHAGAGIYSLNSVQAQLKKEFAEGVLPLWDSAHAPAPLALYIALLRKLNPAGILNVYPGSPWFGAQLLREQDALRLFELHPTDYGHLTAHFAADKRVKIFRQDSLKGLTSLLPPATRRAVILIDPSYEIKTDYSTIIHTLQQAHKRFPSGTYLLWYPIIQRQRIQKMARALQTSGIPDILQLELRTVPDHTAPGMTGSGMFAVNPPWVLRQQMQETLPWLTRQFAPEHGSWNIQTISPEHPS